MFSYGATHGEERELLNYKDDYSFLANEDWDITDSNGLRSTTIAMYYALTSLSTTGLGDFYPKTDSERLLVSFMLLFGVAIFSYILGEIRYMVSTFSFDKDLEEREKLEPFFCVLKKFNGGK